MYFHSRKSELQYERSGSNVKILCVSSVSICSNSDLTPVKTVFPGKKDRKPYILILDIPNGNPLGLQPYSLHMKGIFIGCDTRG